MPDDNQQNYWQNDQTDNDVAATEPPVQQPPQTAEPAPEAALPKESDENLEEAELGDADEAFQPVSWEASEYIHHERDALWVAGFITVTAVLIALAVFILKSYTFAALLVVMAAALAIYAKRPPREIKYTLNSQGLQVDQKFYSFSDFRSFGILHDGALYSVLLFPTARFAPSTHVYFSEGDGEQIVDILASFLPAEDVQFDMIDNLMRRLRL